MNIRAYDEQIQKQVIDSIKRIVKSECEVGGCIIDPKVETYDEYPLTDNDPQITKEVTEAFQKYLGEDR